MGMHALRHSSCEDATIMSKSMLVAGAIGAIWLALSLVLALVMFVRSY